MTVKGANVVAAAAPHSRKQVDGRAHCKAQMRLQQIRRTAGRIARCKLRNYQSRIALLYIQREQRERLADRPTSRPVLRAQRAESSNKEKEITEFMQFVPCVS